MRGSILARLTVIFLIFSSPALAQEAPQVFLANLTEEAMTLAGTANISDQDRTRRFKEIFQRAFAVQDISQMVLGRHWRAATPEQKQEFQRLFEDLLVVTWSRRFKDYHGEKLTVDATIQGQDQDILIASHIDRPGQDPIHVDWRLRAGADGYHVFDIKVEGVSMVMTYRSEYQSVLSGGGVETLLGLLRKKIAETTSQAG